MDTDKGLSYRQARRINPIRIVQIFFIVLGLMVVSGIGYFAYQYLSTKGYFSDGQPQLIEARGPLWERPVERGGKEIEFTNLPINDLVEGVGFDPEKLEVNNFALPPATLPPDAKSLNERGLRLEDIQSITGMGTIENKTAQDILDEFFAEYASGITSTEEVRPQINRSPRPGQQLNPDDVPRGTIMAYLGSFPDRVLANNQWLEFSQNHASVLDKKDWVIFRFEEDEKYSFRLHGLGFSQLEDVQEFCNQILAGGYQFCTPITFK